MAKVKAQDVKEMRMFRSLSPGTICIRRVRRDVWGGGGCPTPLGTTCPEEKAAELSKLREGSPNQMCTF